MARLSKTGSKTSRTKVREISQAKNRKITNTSPNGKRAQTSGRETEVTRLKRELKEALQQQTATANILKVISSSPDDVRPVFDAIVNSAAMLFAPCTAVITTLKDDKLHWNALATLQSDFDFSGAKAVYPLPFDPDRSPSARAILEHRIIEIPDTDAPDTPEYTRKASAAGGFRSATFVPLVHHGRGIGTIILTHPQAGFRLSERQLALVKTFADQAVIAIQNARLFDEVQARTHDLEEALQFQTASADVLKVISQSPDATQPVFDVIVETSRELCKAHASTIFALRNGEFHVAAFAGVQTELLQHMKDHPIAFDQTGSALARAVREKRTVHIPNTIDDPEFVKGGPISISGPRATLTVPLMHDGQVIGGITLRQSHRTPFTPRQIEAIETFADQAVIAISNASLFEQVQQRTRELSKSLDELRAAQDRLVQTEKLASLGQLTAGIAHEIKNPLNFVNNFSGLSVELVDELAEGLKGVAALDDNRRAEFGELTETLRGNLQKVVQHGKRADAIVKNMLLHSRQGSGEYRRVEINALVEESLNLAYHGARAEKQGFEITLERSFDPAAGEADLFPQEITRVLLNLISNGFYAATKRKATVNGGDYQPTLAAATKNLGNSVEIKIRDNGAGIPPEVKEKMFNPFFTTKPTGEGTGLGLSISHDIIVKQHNGSIDVDTQPGEFTEFRIVLPRGAATVAKSGEHA
jgi:signal transduction histidine kinase